MTPRHLPCLGLFLPTSSSVAGLMAVAGRTVGPTSTATGKVLLLLLLASCIVGLLLVRVSATVN